MKKGRVAIGMALAAALLLTGCATEQEKRQRAKIHMDMAAVQIQAGNYIIAHGSYDPNTQTLVVAEEGDFLEVYDKKP